ncbi:Disease resistance protein [Quillaja saponaria]|uniref:Disease resistance protein n=1 Tax=Quillaja saponaria TaxID=32244 RepID=A0AAD7PZJ9_QUISA|nr:Disease resistance protein [Quillaja saponaria]
MDFLIASGTGFTSKVGESLVSPIARQFSYMFEYDKNISKLKEEHEKLKEKKYGVKGKVEADERKARQVPGNIKGWLTRVDKIDGEIEGFYKDEVNRRKRCLGGWCPNLKTRYSMSKKAVKKTEDILNIREEIKVDIMSYRPAPLPLASKYATKDIMSLESRLPTMNEILRTLKDESINIISICGMGGVGKTSLVKMLIKIVEADKLYDEVVMAVVSQNPDIMKIQGQIADGLDFKFDKESELGRAVPDFESIGIPSKEQLKGIKILLTSRNEVECCKMGSKIFKISDLLANESWDLFKMMAADTVDQPNIKQIAKQVVKECGPFPLAIVTVAKALKGKKLHSWEAALARLRKPSRTSFSKMQECIELSYNFLKNKEAKEFLLLSASLFPEDSDIPIEDIFRCGLGFGWFKDSVDVILDARNEVHSLVDELKGCFLLLDSNENGCIKMHDVVRDAAKFIASRPEHGFMIRCDAELMEWPHKDSCHDSSVISLKFGNLKDHPGGLECPKLNLLHVAYGKDSALPECNFFQGMTSLKVLSLQKLEILSDFQPLQNLHTLRLEHCRLKDISAIVIPLKKLEILSLFGSKIDGVSESVGQLSNLKLLDLTNCKVENKGTYHGVFTAPPTSFLQLQELYMRSMYFQWIIDYDTLRSLSRQLKALELVLETDLMPKDLGFENLVKFFIYLGNPSSFEFAYFIFKCFGGFDRSDGFTGPNYFAIEGADYKYIKESFSIPQLMRKSHVLMLVNVINLRNNVHELDGEGFPNLQDLTINKCSDLECLVDESETIDSQCFGRLRSLKVYDCEKLKSFFPSSLAFEKIGFSNLVELTLGRLPCLIGLVHAKGESRQSFTEATVTKIDKYHSLDLEVIFPNLSLKLLDVIQRIEPREVTSFDNLTSLKVSECKRLRYLFSSFVPKLVDNLSTLEVWGCEVLEEVVKKEVDISSHSTSNKLQAYAPRWTSLKSIIIEHCHKLKAFDSEIPILFSFSPSPVIETTKIETSNHQYQFPNKQVALNENKSVVAANVDSITYYQGETLHKVEELLLINCDSLEVVFQLENINYSNPLFNSIHEMFFASLKNLKHIWRMGRQPVIGFQNLRDLYVSECGELTYIMLPPVANLLINLDALYVGQCNALKTVIANGEVNMTYFPLVESIELSHLPELESFCDQSCSLEWPSKVKFDVSGCPKLKNMDKFFINDGGRNVVSDLEEGNNDQAAGTSTK